ncbi:unnamed protein product [Microthlaspi erraticum]|uniref:F-box domain-containing protein n=1 Tax=Microthlaspi erraticum TaxID=1685480 RepID=A0A6D2K9C3_9BRAS|nr:unnamed protein product [Microthlaspi erraticum]
MKTKRRKTRRPNASEGSESRRESSEQIPVDVIIEILLRLPGKSVAKFCCVSKLWASLPRRSYFTELFLTRSSSRPQLLFACQKHNGLFFFSSPQPQNPDKNSSPVAVTSHMKIPFNFNFSKERFPPIRGLLFLRGDQSVEGRRITVSLICNPTTGQFLTLPLPKVTRIGVCVRNYFGYDPIQKQYKVLCMTSTVTGGGRHSVVSEEHQVLTLTREPSWRMIKCGIPHHPYRHQININGICISGVLYYTAATYRSSVVSMLVCFDVRSETFGFIHLNETLVGVVCSGTLINYNGKLGALVLTEGPNSIKASVCKTTSSFKLWILQDAVKEEWSEHTYFLSPSCRDIIGDSHLRFVGVTRRNEIVLSQLYHTWNQNAPFYIYYYDTETKRVVRVRIQGMEASIGNKVCTFIDHVENVFEIV